ncbi:hypothetical protein ACFX2G_044459 [Malus domestica]
MDNKAGVIDNALPVLARRVGGDWKEQYFSAYSFSSFLEEVRKIRSLFRGDCKAWLLMDPLKLEEKLMHCLDYSTGAAFNNAISKSHDSRNMLARKQPNSESIKHLAPTSLSTSRNPTGWASAARLPVEHPLSHASTFETLYV